MPGRNGLELAQDLRTKHPTMPIAVISANMQHEIIAAARGVNATFVGKPLTLEGLRPFLARASLRLQT
jgi:DNA-binding NtrC family response regulator